jgi:hypothetical protein
MYCERAHLRDNKKKCSRLPSQHHFHVPIASEKCCPGDIKPNHHSIQIRAGADSIRLRTDFQIRFQLSKIGCFGLRRVLCWLPARAETHPAPRSVIA